MMKNGPREFNAKDEKVIKIFANLGMPKNLAKTLLYIFNTNECRSAEIEHYANLRQPEVSIAIQELYRRGWIKKKELKKKGKGRPINVYSLSCSIEDVIKNFEQEKMKEIQNIQQDLKELKNLIGKKD